MQDDLRKQTGNAEKRIWSGFKVEESLEKEITDFAEDKVKENLNIPEKTKRYRDFDEIKEQVMQHISKEEDSESETVTKKNSRTSQIVFQFIQHR